MNIADLAVKLGAFALGMYEAIKDLVEKSGLMKPDEFDAAVKAENSRVDSWASSLLAKLTLK